MDDFLSRIRTASGKRAIYLAIALLLGSVLAGCGPKPPFELATVNGKVIYSDGTPIQADQLLVKFVPQGIKIEGKNAPRAAETYADGSDGTFADLTTWKYADGVMVGHHKVVVVSLKVGKHGMGEPTKAVPSAYNQVETTPLEVDVVPGKNHFELKVRRDL